MADTFTAGAQMISSTRARGKIGVALAVVMLLLLVSPAQAYRGAPWFKPGHVYAE